MVSHSKCEKCTSILNVIDLKNNPEGEGMVCKDEAECKKRQNQAKKASTPQTQPSINPPLTPA